MKKSLSVTAFWPEPSLTLTAEITVNISFRFLWGIRRLRWSKFYTFAYKILFIILLLQFYWLFIYTWLDVFWFHCDFFSITKRGSLLWSRRNQSNNYRTVYNFSSYLNFLPVVFSKSNMVAVSDRPVGASGPFSVLRCSSRVKQEKSWRLRIGCRHHRPLFTQIDRILLSHANNLNRKFRGTCPRHGRMIVLFVAIGGQAKFSRYTSPDILNSTHIYFSIFNSSVYLSPMYITIEDFTLSSYQN